MRQCFTDSWIYSIPQLKTLKGNNFTKCGIHIAMEYTYYSHVPCYIGLVSAGAKRVRCLHQGGSSRA